MSHARVVCRNSLLLIGVTLAALAAASGVARAASFGEVTRFGGPGKTPGELTPSVYPSEGAKDYFEFQPWHVLGVDSKTNDIFVLEEYKESKEKKNKTVENSIRYLRLQELSDTGAPLAEREFEVTTPDNGNAEVPFEPEEIEGIAVDPEAGRLYFLLTEERGSEVAKKEFTDEGEGAAAYLYAFETTPSGKTLVPAPGASSEGVLAGPEKLEPQSSQPGVALLTPHGITVDPKTHEVVIAAHVDTETTCEEGQAFEEECEPDLLSSPADHYATQRITEAGALGARDIDTGNALKQEAANELLAPGSPVVVKSGSSERTLTDHFLGTETGEERLLAEFPLSGAPVDLPLPGAAGLEKGFGEIIDGNESDADIGGSLVASPEGNILYGFTDINNEEAGSGEELYAISERSAETLAPIGWTGGQRADANDECVLQPGIDSGEQAQLAVGKEGDIFVLVPEYLHVSGATGKPFPSDDAIIEFGPGGKGCPPASAEKAEALVNGKEVKEVSTAVPVTLSTFVKQGDALSVLWKLENETTKATAVTIEQNTDQYQKPELEHTFTEPGKYKITEEIKTDNLATPTTTASISLEASGKSEAVHITTEPASQTVKSGETARFTAAAAGTPTPSPQWWVSTDGGASFEEDKEAGAKKPTLEVAATEAKNGYEYYAVFTNSQKESADTDKVTLTVTAAESPPPTETTSTTPTTTTPTQTVTTPPGGGVLPLKVIAPTATTAGKWLVSSSGAVSVKVSCAPGATTCIGTVTLKTATALKLTAGKKKTVVTLATGSFSVSGGQVETITLHLSAMARKLLAKLHALRTRETVASHDPADEKVTGTKLLDLRRAPVKRKH